MKYAVDLHIHTALSPCADNDMTPNNIANMAALKGLDVIAVTDHNSVENFEALSKCAERVNILVVPGMEIETREEVHLVCYFPYLEAALKIQRIVQEALPPIKNREDIFGQQLVMDEDDNIKRHKKCLLLTAANLSVQQVFSAVSSVGGAVIPAHVDRQSYSIISNLGTVPEELDIKYIEISKNCCWENCTQKYPGLAKYRHLKSSDAHSLGDILERQSFIEMSSKSVRCIINQFKSSAF